MRFRRHARACAVRLRLPSARRAGVADGPGAGARGFARSVQPAGRIAGAGARARRRHACARSGGGRSPRCRCSPKDSPIPRSASTSSAARRNSRCVTRWCSRCVAPTTAATSCRRQAIELSRDYVASPRDSLGKNSERELLTREMRRDMTQAILRRIDAVSRNKQFLSRRCRGGTDAGTARQPTRRRAAAARLSDRRSRAAARARSGGCGSRHRRARRAMPNAKCSRPTRATSTGTGCRPVSALPACSPRSACWNCACPPAKPGKEGAEVITDFCAQPPGDVLLLVTGGEWSKQHGGKWSEAIGRIGHVVVAWAVKPHELPDWIERRLRAKRLAGRPRCGDAIWRTRGGQPARRRAGDRQAGPAQRRPHARPAHAWRRWSPTRRATTSSA